MMAVRVCEGLLWLWGVVMAVRVCDGCEDL